MLALTVWSGFRVSTPDQTEHFDPTESDEYIQLQNLYNALNNRYSSLQANYSQLDNQYTSLQTTYNSLRSDYNRLDAQYNTLQSDYNQLDAQYNTLQSDYNQLDTQYNTLQSDYDYLNTQYLTLLLDYYTLEDNYEVEITMDIGHLLNDYYEVIRGECTPTGWWIYQPSNQEFADLAAKIAEHGLGTTYWPDFEDEFYQASEVAYGNKIYSYDKAKEQLLAIKNLTDISTSDNNTVIIEKILDFINDYIHYEPDMDNNFLAPMETLSLNSGDCEDYSILAGALFELLNIESAIALGEKSGTPHAFVLVKLDNLGTYGYWHFDDLTGYGLPSGQWIIIEPQARIEQQSEAGEDMTLNVATEISG